ncbi:MAG: hypothetical protein K8R92_00625 [Planctomycetes bacterium]|nr:hypothetical protein [Planctomycetota bacterium]
MEFVTFEEAWSLLRRLGVTKATDTPKEFRLELADSPSVVVIDVAAADHAEIKSLPADLRRVPRNAIANFIEALVHKMHLQRTYLIPVGNWRKVFEAVSPGMASSPAWRMVDAAACVELNTRDPLVFTLADAHTLRDLIRVILKDGRGIEHGVTLCSDGAPLVIEVMPAGEMIIFAGRPELARQCTELLAHVKAD